MVQKGSRQFEILSGNEIIVTGTIKLLQSTDEIFASQKSLYINDDDTHLTGNEVYHEFKHRGHKYSGAFKAIKSVAVTEEGEDIMKQI